MLFGSLAFVVRGERRKRREPGENAFHEVVAREARVEEEEEEEGNRQRRKQKGRALVRPRKTRNHLSAGENMNLPDHRLGVDQRERERERER